MDFRRRINEQYDICKERYGGKHFFLVMSRKTYIDFVYYARNFTGGPLKKKVVAYPVKYLGLSIVVDPEILLDYLRVLPSPEQVLLKRTN